MCFPVNSSLLTGESLVNLPSNGSVRRPSPCRKVRTVSVPSVHTLQRARLPRGALVLFSDRICCQTSLCHMTERPSPPSNTWHNPVHSASRKIIIPLMGFPPGTSQAIYCRHFSAKTLTSFFWSIYSIAGTSLPIKETQDWETICVLYTQYLCLILNKSIAPVRLDLELSSALS